MLHYLMQTYGELAGLPVEKRNFHGLKHSIATYLLDAGADLALVKDWLGPAKIQNTTIYARLTTAPRDSTAQKVFASHRGVSCLLVSGERRDTLSWTPCLCLTLATLQAVADEAGHPEADHEQDIDIGLWDFDAIVFLVVMAVMAMFVMVTAWPCGVTHSWC